MSDTIQALQQEDANAFSLSKNFAQATIPFLSVLNGAQKNIIMLSGEVTSDKADQICMQMLSLATAQPGQDIIFYIDSPGGSVEAGMAIYDMMQTLGCVRTVGNGQGSSMGSFLVAAGKDGHRYVMPNTQIMLHQPSAGTKGTVSDMQRAIKHFTNVKNRMCQAYSRWADLSVKDCETLLDRDTHINAVTARALGLVDHIVAPAQSLSAKQQRIFHLGLADQQAELNTEPELLAIIARRNQTLNPGVVPQPANDAAPFTPRLVG